ncbi:hypothetical protein ES703_87429 [subsurface metagenome]
MIKTLDEVEPRIPISSVPYTISESGSYYLTGDLTYTTTTGNTAYLNAEYGIIVGNYCLVDQNTAYGNGTNMYIGGGCVLGTNCAP